MKHRIIMFIAAICVVAMITIALHVQLTYYRDGYAAYIFAIPMSIVAVIMIQVSFSKEGA
jgi:hypothetical protein